MNTSKSVISKLSAGALMIIALAFAVATVALAVDPTNCWCCYRAGFPGHTVIHTTPADCAAKHGQCYATKAEAINACPGPPIGKCYCCKDGKVMYITKVECQEIQGTCYDTAQQANIHCPHKIDQGGTKK